MVSLIWCRNQCTSIWPTIEILNRPIYFITTHVWYISTDCNLKYILNELIQKKKKIVCMHAKDWCFLLALGTSGVGCKQQHSLCLTLIYTFLGWAVDFKATLCSSRHMWEYYIKVWDVQCKKKKHWAKCVPTLSVFTYTTFQKGLGKHHLLLQNKLKGVCPNMFVHLLRYHCRMNGKAAATVCYV